MAFRDRLRNACAADDRARDIGAAFLQALSHAKLSGCIGAILLLAYFAELAAPTFSTDYFYTLEHSARRINYADGRLIAGLLDIATSNHHPPTLFLAVGLVALAGAGLLFALMLGVRAWVPLLLSACLVATFPHFYEPLSYPAIRISLPLSVLFAISAVAIGRVFSGALLIFFAAGLYQAGVYCAVVATLVLAALRSAQGASAREVFHGVIRPRALAIILGLGGYGVLMVVFKLTDAISLRRI